MIKIPVAREGLKIAAPLFILTVMGAGIDWTVSLVFLLLCVLTLLFFRDPARSSPGDENVIVSPADGRVVGIREFPETAETWNLVSIFMSPLDVHINYAPVGGRVVEVRHERGAFLRADQKEASDRNESNTLVIEAKHFQMRMKQIAGIFARRIVCRLKPGDQVKAGQRIGLIQFGSRVDVYLPRSVRVSVNSGQRVRGAETVIGVMQ